MSDFKRGALVTIDEEHLAQQLAFIDSSETTMPLQVESVALMQELRGERMKVIGRGFGPAQNWIVVQLDDNTIREVHQTLLVPTT